MTEKLPIFISAEALHDAIGADDLQIVAVDGPGDHAAGHIPGALQIAMADFTAAAPPVAGLLPAEAELERVFAAAGLRENAHIVAYDRAGDNQAARFLYTLDAMGHNAFSLLDGGLAAWADAGLKLETGDVQAPQGDLGAERQPERIADRAWIEQRLGDAGTLFVDARSAPEFAGSDVRSARGGHIPGAISLDWQLLKDRNGRLRPRAELLELLHSHGVDREAAIVNYCQSHTRSSYTYLVLKWLGYANIRGYPGSWSDWGNADDTPIESSRS